MPHVVNRLPRSSSQYACDRYHLGQRQDDVGFRELRLHLTDAASDLSLVRLDMAGQSQVMCDKASPPAEDARMFQGRFLVLRCWGAIAKIPFVFPILQHHYSKDLVIDD